MAERTIVISQDINEEIAREVIERILEINEIDEMNDADFKDYTRQPIKIIVNSFGGSVCDGFAIMDAMKYSRTPIDTYCFGSAMSMGFAIFLAGDARYCGKNSTFMYHEISGYCHDNLSFMKLKVEEMERLQKMYDDFVVERTSLQQDWLELRKQVKEDWYMSAEDALKFGICHTIL